MPDGRRLVPADVNVLISPLPAGSVASADPPSTRMTEHWFSLPTMGRAHRIPRSAHPATRVRTDKIDFPRTPEVSLCNGVLCQFFNCYRDLFSGCIGPRGQRLKH